MREKSTVVVQWIYAILRAGKHSIGNIKTRTKKSCMVVRCLELRQNPRAPVIFPRFLSARPAVVSSSCGESLSLFFLLLAFHISSGIHNPHPQPHPDDFTIPSLVSSLRYRHITHL